MPCVLFFCHFIVLLLFLNEIRGDGDGDVEQLVLPQSRRMQAIRLAHDIYGGHLASKKTKARFKLSFTWPTIAMDVQKACETCDHCQKRKRVTVYDRVPITPVPRM